MKLKQSYMLQFLLKMEEASIRAQRSPRARVTTREWEGNKWFDRWTVAEYASTSELLLSF